MPASVLRKYGTALSAGTAGSDLIRMSIRTAGSADFNSAWVPAAGDVKVSKDGGAQANIGTLPSYSNGSWEFTLSATELEAKTVRIVIVDAATKAIDDDEITVETFGHASANYPAIYSAGSAGNPITSGTGTDQLSVSGGRAKADVMYLGGAPYPAMSYAGETAHLEVALTTNGVAQIVADMLTAIGGTTANCLSNGSLSTIEIDAVPNGNFIGALLTVNAGWAIVTAYDLDLGTVTLDRAVNASIGADVVILPSGPGTAAIATAVATHATITNTQTQATTAATKSTQALAAIQAYPSGGGALAVTLTVTSSGTPVNGATVRLAAGTAFTATTNSSGIASFSLDAGTYTLSITKAGYSYTPSSQVISASGNIAASITRISVTAPAGPGQSVGLLLVLDENGDAAAGETISFRMTAGPGAAGNSYPGAIFQAVSGSNGQVQVTLAIGATYEASRDDGEWVEFTVPNAVSFDLPEVLGRLGQSK